MYLVNDFSFRENTENTSWKSCKICNCSICHCTERDLWCDPCPRLAYLCSRNAAKQATGKPLVVHVHATEFDRSGENVNQTVYEIERKGMEEADLVITVSNLTRQIVIDDTGFLVINHHCSHAVEPADKPEIEEVKNMWRKKSLTFLGRVTFQKDLIISLRQLTRFYKGSQCAVVHGGIGRFA